MLYQFYNKVRSKTVTLKRKRVIMDWGELGQRKKAFDAIKKLEFGVCVCFNMEKQWIRSDIITIFNRTGVIM